MGKKIAGKLVDFQYAVSIFCALLLLLMIAWEVLARYVFKISLMGVDEWMVFPIIWLYMLGGCNASYEKSHIECGILVLYIKKERTKLLFECMKRTLSVIILAWITYWGGYYFLYSLYTWKLADISSAPLFFANIALTIGFLIMEIYAIRDVIKAYKDLAAYNANKREGETA